MATHTYRFSEFQAGLVESGEKTMTIRAPRKAPTRVGDTLRLTGPVFAGFGKMAANPGVRFAAHNGLKSDIAPCPKCAHKPTSTWRRRNGRPAV